MRWTDEVHSERTLEARREAKLFSRGQEISAKGRTELELLVLATGMPCEAWLGLMLFVLQCAKCPLTSAHVPQLALSSFCSCYNAGMFAALAQCESRGKLRVARLPFIGPWASRKLFLLRRRLSDPLGKRSSGSSARESIRSAALRRQVCCPTYSHPNSQWCNEADLQQTEQNSLIKLDMSQSTSDADFLNGSVSSSLPSWLWDSLR